MPKLKRVAVILSGCGHQDGTEITEAVSMLIALSEAAVEVQMFAPVNSFAVTDPLTSQPTGERRQILHEAARIARGEVRPLLELSAPKFDALAFPGGYGAARNLCTWGLTGAACSVDPQVERIINEFYMAEKPIAALCIAPVLLARVLGSEGVTLTIGNDRETAAEIAKTGAHHVDCAVDDFVSDREHRVISTPAYMYGDAQPFAVFTGVRKAMRELVEMA